MNRNKTKSGFSLIELLVVIAIIGILSTIVLIQLNTAKDKSKISKAQTELNQIRNALTNLSIDKE